MLADPTRRSILEILAATGELSASEIHNKFKSSPQAISQHLKILRETNLVYMEKRAQQRIYRINTETLTRFDEWTKNMRQLWSHRLDAMEAVLKVEMANDIPVDLVWKAWTDPKLVVLWWGPTHFTSPRCEIDLREGGKYLFCMRTPEEQGGLDLLSS